jgi:polar amino acid transport system substrate-binding protein
MGRTGRSTQLVLVVVLLSVALLGAGCSQPKPVELQPKVTPPAVKEAGTLKAGIDVGYPPLGGADNGQNAGIDVDVAAALAERLGLKLVIVPIKASNAATELANGTVDVATSVPFSDESLSNLSVTGSYISDAPSFFVATEGTASVVPSMTVVKLPPPPAKIGAQKGSPAYWQLIRDIGPESVTGYATLRDAMDALDKGDVAVVAGDALVGAYIGRDFPNVHFAGQMQPATLLGVAVASDNTKLADATREALNGLAADGVLEAIRGKWVGGLAKLTGPRAPTSETTGSTKP